MFRQTLNTAIAGLLVATLVSGVSAATIQRDGTDGANMLDLNLAGGWIDPGDGGGQRVPGSDDIAAFWSVSGGVMPTPVLGADLEWLGMTVALGQFNAGTVIGSDGHTLTLGASGITMTADRGTTFDNDFALAADQSWNTGAMASAKAATFNGNVNLDSFTLTLTAKGGKNMNGAISGTGGLRASTQSSVNLRGVNTYTGDTTVLGGTLNLFDDAQLKFVIGANGVNNMITSNGADDNGVLQVNGDFLLDLTGAGTNVGDAWTIVDISSDLVTTFGETFNVTGFTSTGTAGSRVWTADANGVTYAFAEPTGLLTVVPEPATTVLLLTGLAGLIARRKR